VAISKISKA